MKLIPAKHIVHKIVWILLSGVLVTALLSVGSKADRITVQGLKIEILPEDELAFLDSGRVLEILHASDTGFRLFGTAAADLNSGNMERVLERYPFIENADVFHDLDGNVRIRIMQRRPVLRVINRAGQSYYVAKNGFKMPLHPGFAPRVLAANGNITENLEDTAYAGSKTLHDLLALVAELDKDPFWQAQIEQVYVDNYLDMILVPRVGNHSIVFGSADDAGRKLNALKLFYAKGLNHAGWNEYRKIDLRFNGQIVAERKENNQNTQQAQP